MGKGALKFGGKSGILPVPRQIFKQPYKHQVYQKEADTGYADNILHPKGTSREYQPPKVFTPEERLLKTASKPKKQYSSLEFEKMPIQQKFKIKNAEMRRNYLKESYESEVSRLEKIEEKSKQQIDLQNELKAEAESYQRSKAELYTIPTIESYLNGPLITPRTPEQKEALKLKKESNRLQQELNVKTNLAVKLLELYNASSAFAITEDKLELMVDSAFSEKNLQEMDSLLNIDAQQLGKMPSDQTFDNALKDAIIGKANKGPGFDVVTDTMTGYNAELYELAEQLKEEKAQLAKKKAEEKQQELMDLQEQILMERQNASIGKAEGDKN